MGCPGQGPCCVYPLDLGCCLVSGSIPESCLTDGTPVSQGIIDSAILTASQFLWAVTGRTYGICQVDIRPCRICPNECCIPEGGWGWGWSGGFPAYPMHQSDGTWINVSCPCENECSCVNLCEVALPYPTCSIDQILIDGMVVDPTTYKVDEFRKLVRLGNECWPACNLLNLPPTEVGTWQITLTYGIPPPELILKAAAEFACQLILGCVGSSLCKLPRNVTAVTRQGITEVFANPLEFFRDGYTGLFLVDLAIRTYNPKMLQRRPFVYSPDVKRKWRVTTWNPGDPIGEVCP